MPRPTKTHADRRVKRIEIRLTETEEVCLIDLAKERGLSLSDHVRQVVLNCKPRIQKATPERAVLIKGLGDLGRVGNNLNQIAKALNTDILINRRNTLPDQIITETLTVLHTLSCHLVNTLTNGH